MEGSAYRSNTQKCDAMQVRRHVRDRPGISRDVQQRRHPEAAALWRQRCVGQCQACCCHMPWLRPHEQPCSGGPPLAPGFSLAFRRQPQPFPSRVCPFASQCTAVKRMIFRKMPVLLAFHRHCCNMLQTEYHSLSGAAACVSFAVSDHDALRTFPGSSVSALALSSLALFQWTQGACLLCATWQMPMGTARAKVTQRSYLVTARGNCFTNSAVVHLFCNKTGLIAYRAFPPPPHPRGSAPAPFPIFLSSTKVDLPLGSDVYQHSHTMQLACNHPGAAAAE